MKSGDLLNKNCIKYWKQVFQFPVKFTIFQFLQKQLNSNHFNQTQSMETKAQLTTLISQLKSNTKK